jgi:hypothetical protein
LAVVFVGKRIGLLFDQESCSSQMSHPRFIGNEVAAPAGNIFLGRGIDNVTIIFETNRNQQVRTNTRDFDRKRT